MTRLEIDREMQVEVATDPELRLSVYPHNTLTGALNVLLFPNLAPPHKQMRGSLRSTGHS